MKRIVIAAASVLAMAGCANLNNMTPEQREAFFAQMRTNAAAQQQQQNFLYQQQMNAINAWGANNAARAGTNCTTSYVGNQAYTHCQ